MLSNLTEMEGIELYSPPYGFTKNLWQIHLRENHVKLTGKNTVGNGITWAKLRGLNGQKWQSSVQ